MKEHHAQIGRLLKERDELKLVLCSTMGYVPLDDRPALVSKNDAITYATVTIPESPQSTITSVARKDKVEEAIRLRLDEFIVRVALLGVENEGEE
jgi:hypothetical protein